MKDSQTISYQQEELLLQSLNTSLTELELFLKEIILIENLFTKLYISIKDEQQKARYKYSEKYLTQYEKSTTKPISKIGSYPTLLSFTATCFHYFKIYVNKITKAIQRENLKLWGSPNIGLKEAPRMFYKAFYVYEGNVGQLTDVLRCSFAFEDFAGIYRAFNIIMQHSKDDDGILRVKDRFNSENAEFGYRDILINTYCPNTSKQIVCEIQLHHKLFFQHKKKTITSLLSTCEII